MARADAVGHLTGRISFDHFAAIDRWLGLTADMLTIGYFPTTKIHTGNCVQEHNLVVDGGMCDIDSIERMSDVMDKRDFLDALLVSIMQLSDSIGNILSRTATSSRRESRMRAISWGAVWPEICKRIKASPIITSCDPRLRESIDREGLDSLKMILKEFGWI
jgi:hypothetical protein